MGYFEEYMSKQGVLIKVSNSQLFFKPETEHFKGTVGVKSFCNAKAGELSGQIEVKAEFVLPEKFEVKFSQEDKNFIKILEYLEFIKTTGELPPWQTGGLQLKK